MGTQYFTIDKIPDYTMAKYSIQEGGGVEDVLKQHASFYRQLHRRGLLFQENYSLIYEYDPSRLPGKKLRVFFKVESKNEIPFMDQSIQSASLATGFQFQPYQPEQNAAGYSAAAWLEKKSGWIASSLPENSSEYYVVDEWKANEKGRLMGLFRLMKALDCRCSYSIRIYPVDLSESYRVSLQKQMKWMKPVSGGIGMMSQKDENADKCVKIYNDTIDHLRQNPHFYGEVAAYADDPKIAKLLVDAAASEAVEEGSYQVNEVVNGTYTPLLPHALLYRPDERIPEHTKFWKILFMLKEIVPMACFPTLYPGESIEIPKETAPVYEKEGLYIGKDQQGYDVYMPLPLLPKHALLAGVPGSGKTYTMLHIASQIAGKKNKIPILVLEPAKQEYRALVQNPEVHDLTVFAPGGSGSFPLRINPFEFPKGMKLSEHIVNLRQVFIGAFDLEPPMPFLLDQGIENVYRACGWYPFDYNDFDENGHNIKPYPNMEMLFDEVEKLLNASDYAEDVKNNLKTVLQVRIGSLVSRETGNVFNVPRSTFRPEEWMLHSCVLELESLGKDAANFLTLLLATLIREIIKLHPKSAVSPRHVMFFEEAHNLIGPSTEPTQNSGNAKTASTKFIVDMLAEVRALKEAIVIADQLPTALASQVTKNTSLKIGLRITAQDDREMLASTMSADGVQLEQMALFTPGQALCMYEGVQKPFEVHIAPYSGNADSPDNEALYAIQCKNATYQMCMTRDMMIMEQRLHSRTGKYLDDWIEYVKTGESLQDMKAMIFKISNPEERNEKLKWWKGQVEGLFESRKRLLNKHLEVLLEFGEYVRINQMERKKGAEILKNDVQELFDCIDANNTDINHSLEPFENQARMEIVKMWKNITRIR